MTTPSGSAAGATTRSLRLPDAVGTGIAATLGAGLFVGFAPVASSAGDHLIWSVVLAAAVTIINAVSSLRLAATHRSNLGTHVHARQQLGVAWGHLAGWSFVVGATSACAALALTIGMHVLPGWPKALGAVAVLAVLGLHLQGIERSERAERLVGVGVLLVVLLFVVTLLATPPVLADAPPSNPEGSGGLIGIVQAAGIVFFALAGHLRLVNLRGRIAGPRTVARAIALSLGAVIALHLLLAVALDRTLGMGWVAARQAPLAEAAEISAWPWLGPVLRVAAVLAAGGILMTLMASAADTVAGMARDRHLPVALAVRDGARRIPRRSLSVVAGFVVVSVVLVDVRQAMAFAAFCALIHFALVHASVWTLDARWSHRVVPGLGLVSCLVVAVLLPWQTVLAGALVLALGAFIGWVRHTTRE